MGAKCINFSKLSTYIINYNKSSSRCYTITNTHFFTFDLYLGVKVTQNVARSTIYIMPPMHMQIFKLLHPILKEEMHLQENTLFSGEICSFSVKYLIEIGLMGEKSHSKCNLAKDFV